MAESKLYHISREITSPVLISYVEWILRDAQQRGLKTLWFLARDGYPLMRIAQALCRARSIDIDCRYLYCSRVALRTPSYHLIGDEAFDLLFLYGFHVTVNSFFDRAAVPEDMRKLILTDMGLTETDAARELPPTAMEEWKRRFRSNARYCAHVAALSKAAYDTAIAYFRQEGLLDAPTAAFVDSGWSGSMQRSLRQLLASAGFSGDIIGYYFGMYAEPKPEDGTYLTYLFSRSERIYNKLFFNNNLFECMLSAPHGMTMAYSLQNGAYGPVQGKLPSGGMTRAIDEQLRGIMDGVNDCLAQTAPDSQYARKARMRLRRLMTCPTREEADAFSAFLFCDDITEKNHYALADDAQLACIPEHTLTRRVWRKLTRRRAGNLFVPFWIYGTIAFIPSPVKRLWYRLNVWAWDALRYLLHKA